MVAGHDDHLPVGAHTLPKGSQDGLGGVHRALRVARQQLHRVAEQDEAVDVVQRGQQPLTGSGQPQNVMTQADAEVQIGDDQRAHGGAR